MPRINFLELSFCNKWIIELCGFYFLRSNKNLDIIDFKLYLTQNS
jgi:hypothetical protein